MPQAKLNRRLKQRTILLLYSMCKINLTNNCRNKLIRIVLPSASAGSVSSYSLVFRMSKYLLSFVLCRMDVYKILLSCSLPMNYSLIDHSAGHRVWPLLCFIITPLTVGTSKFTIVFHSFGCYIWFRPEVGAGPFFWKSRNTPQK